MQRIDRSPRAEAARTNSDGEYDKPEGAAMLRVLFVLAMVAVLIVVVAGGK